MGRPRRTVPTAARAARRPWRAILAVSALILISLITLAASEALDPRRAWRPLRPDLGQVRWVAMDTGFASQPPTAPGWVRFLHSAGIPWPSDLPDRPIGVGFGRGGGPGPRATAWFLVRSARPSRELWKIDKSSVVLTARDGVIVPFPGGGGSALVDARRRTQLIALPLPPEATAPRQLHVRFRLWIEGERPAPGASPMEQRPGIPPGAILSEPVEFALRW